MLACTINQLDRYKHFNCQHLAGHIPLSTWPGMNVRTVNTSTLTLLVRFRGTACQRINTTFIQLARYKHMQTVNTSTRAVVQPVIHSIQAVNTSKFVIIELARYNHTDCQHIKIRHYLTGQIQTCRLSTHLNMSSPNRPFTNIQAANTSTHLIIQSARCKHTGYQHINTHHHPTGQTQKYRLSRHQQALPSNRPDTNAQAVNTSTHIIIPPARHKNTGCQHINTHCHPTGQIQTYKLSTDQHASSSKRLDANVQAVNKSANVIIQPAHTNIQAVNTSDRAIIQQARYKHTGCQHISTLRYKHAGCQQISTHHHSTGQIQTYRLSTHHHSIGQIQIYRLSKHTL